MEGIKVYDIKDLGNSYEEAVPHVLEDLKLTVEGLVRFDETKK